MQFVVNWHYCVCYISVSQPLPSTVAVKYSSVIHSTQNHVAYYCALVYHYVRVHRLPSFCAP